MHTKPSWKTTNWTYSLLFYTIKMQQAELTSLCMMHRSSSYNSCCISNRLKQLAVLYVFFKSDIVYISAIKCLF